MDENTKRMTLMTRWAKIDNDVEIVSTSTPTHDRLTPISPTNPPTARIAAPQSSPTPKRMGYEFPEKIDPAKPYLIYLHGKIIEDQGIPAVSPEFGEYEYEKILETLNGYGFVVISKQRPSIPIRGYPIDLRFQR
jgi:hypothetical protein